MSAPNPAWVEGCPGMPACTIARKAEIRMVEDIKELAVKPQLYVFGQGKPFRQVEVAPEKIGTAQGVAAEASELAILRVSPP